MPITPQYRYEQTRDEVVIILTLNAGVKRSGIDLFVSPCFVKINIQPGGYLLELDLFGTIACAPSAAATAGAAGDSKSADRDADLNPSVAPGGVHSNVKTVISGKEVSFTLKKSAESLGVWSDLQFNTSAASKTARLHRRASSVTIQEAALTAHRAYLSDLSKRTEKRALEAGWDYTAQQKDAIKQLAQHATDSAHSDVNQWAKSSYAAEAAAAAKPASNGANAKPASASTAAASKPAAAKVEPATAYLEEIDEAAEERERQLLAEQQAKADAEAAAAAARDAIKNKQIWDDAAPAPTAKPAAAASATAPTATAASAALPPVRTYHRVEVKFTARPGPLATTAAREDSDRKTMKSITDWSMRHQPAWLTAMMNTTAAGASNNSSGLHPDAVRVKDKADKFARVPDYASAVSAYSTVIQIQLNTHTATPNGAAAAASIPGGNVPPTLYANRSACYLAMAKAANLNATPTAGGDTKSNAAAAAPPNASDLSQYRVHLKLCIRDCNKVVQLVQSVATPTPTASKPAPAATDAALTAVVAATPNAGAAAAAADAGPSVGTIPSVLVSLYYKTLLRRGTAYWWLGSLTSALADHRSARQVATEYKLFAASPPAAAVGSPLPAASNALASLDADIATLSALHTHVHKDRTHLAFKKVGNDAYAARQYEAAIDAYSKSLQLYPLSVVCLSNRAMCYLALNPPNIYGCIRDCSHVLLLWDDSELVRRQQREVSDRRVARQERWVKYRAERAKEKAMRKMMSQAEAAKEAAMLIPTNGAPAPAPAQADKPKKKKKSTADADDHDDDDDDESSGEDEAESDPNYSEVSDSHAADGGGGVDADCIDADHDTQLTANCPHATRAVFMAKVLNRRACAYVCADELDAAEADYRKANGLTETELDLLSGKMAANPAPAADVLQVMRSSHAKLKQLSVSLATEMRVVTTGVKIARVSALAHHAITSERKYEKAKEMYSELESSILANCRVKPAPATTTAAAAAPKPAIQLKWESMRLNWLTLQLPVVYSNRALCQLAANAYPEATRDADRAIDALRYNNSSADFSAVLTPAAVSAAVFPLIWQLAEAMAKPDATTTAAAASIAGARARLLELWSSASRTDSDRRTECRRIECVILTLVRRGTARAYNGLLIDAQFDLAVARAVYAIAQSLPLTTAAGDKRMAVSALNITPAAWTALESDLLRLNGVAQKFGLNSTAGPSDRKQQ